MKFWSWLRHGSGGKPGYKRLVDRWLLVHLAAGGLVTYLSPRPLESDAATVLLPLASVFTGMSFAWIGNAQSLLASTEMEAVARRAPGGRADYAFTFQLAMLIILIALGWWGIAALGILDEPCPFDCGPAWYQAARIFSFALLSLMLRTSWQVVVGTQSMLLTSGTAKDLLAAKPPTEAMGPAPAETHPVGAREGGHQG